MAHQPVREGNRPQPTLTRGAASRQRAEFRGWPPTTEIHRATARARTHSRLHPLFTPSETRPRPLIGSVMGHHPAALNARSPTRKRRTTTR